MVPRTRRDGDYSHRPRRDEGPDARRYAAAVLNEKIRPVIEPITTGTGRLLARAHISPNGLTITGLLAVAGCAALLASGRTVLAGLLLVPAFLLDVFDGALARVTGRVSAWGGFLDSVADRVADAIVFGAFAWLYRDGEPRLFIASLTALAVTQFVPYARSKAEALGFTAPGGLGERGERAVLVIIGLVFGIEEIALWLIVATAVVTFLARIKAVRDQAARAG